jgi:hypothetical protein
LGELPVFYDVVLDERRCFRILAVGWKEGSRLFIGGKEFRL